MLKNFLNQQSKSITGAAILIASAALISRIIGLLRDRIFAHYFGAGPVMDAYYAAFKIPDLIYNLLIVGALSAGFIPIFTKLLTSKNKNAAWRLTNNVLNIIALALIILVALGIIYMPHLMPYLAPGFNDSTMQLAINFARITFISTFLLSLSMVMGTILQSLRSFLLFSIAPIFYNVGIIFGVIVLVPIFGTIGLAWGVVLGAAIHFFIQTYGAYKQGYRWKWYFNLADKETKLVGKLMIPRTLGLAINQINVVVITILASLLPIGSVAVYNYAHNLQGVSLGIIGIPFALAVFPVLSSAAAKNNMDKFVKHLSATIRQIIFLIVPISIIILLLRAQIVRVVLGSGAFGWAATINTADALALFSLSLFAQSLIPLLARAFYALENTKTPFIICLISELVAIIAALILMKPLGVAGLALATSVGAILNFVLLAISIRYTTKHLEEEKILSSFYRISIAGIAMAITVQLFKYPLAKIFNQEYLIGILMHGLLAGLFGLAVYGFICYLLKLPEFLQFWGSFKRRWLRLKGITIEEGIELKN